MRYSSKFSSSYRVGAALLRGDVTQEDLVSFVEAFLNNREAQLEPLRERLAAATAEPRPWAVPTTREGQLAELLAVLQTDETVERDDFEWHVTAESAETGWKYSFSDAEAFKLNRLVFALLAGAPAASAAAKLAAAERLVAALLPSGRQEWADQSPYMSGPGNAVCRADFSSDDCRQDGEPLFDENGDERDSVYYWFHPEQSREIHAAVSDWFAASED